MAAAAPGPSCAIGRRGLLAAGMAILAWRATRTAAAAEAAGATASSLAFQVSRNGSPIGTHRLDFTHDGADTTVRIDAAFRVGVAFITVYRYRHQGTEIWRGGRFESLTTQTDDNGRLFQVQARRTQAGILISATGLADVLAPPDALPLTHWAEAAMHAPLFNPQTGKLLHETGRPQGCGTVDLANGTPIRATRYALAGEAPIEDWYDSSRVWAALDATGTDGSRITYRRV